VRVVLDTGVIVSALLFSAGHLGWLRARWAGAEIIPLVSRDTVDELVRVLAYPKFTLTHEEIDAVLAAYLPFTEAVPLSGPGAVRLPECDDPADQPFLGLALEGRAELLVTGDDHLLRLRGQTPFEIVRPAELRMRLP